MNIGRELEGITGDEVFQYHDTFLKHNNLKMEKADWFYREVAYPMHYIQIQEFLEDLDCICSDK